MTTKHFTSPDIIYTGTLIFQVPEAPIVNNVKSGEHISLVKVYVNVKRNYF